jgi:hypothetical protein
MMDFNATPEEIARAHERRLQLRARIRQENEWRPRCSGCGCDMPVFSAGDVITPEQFADPRYGWLHEEDFRPGDIVCFWCVCGMVEMGGRFVWGRA